MGAKKNNNLLKRILTFLKDVLLFAPGFEFKIPRTSETVMRVIGGFEIKSTFDTTYKIEIDTEAFPMQFKISRLSGRETEAVIVGTIIAIDAMRLTIIRGRAYPTQWSCGLAVMIPFVVMPMFFCASQSNVTGLVTILYLFLMGSQMVFWLYLLSRPFHLFRLFCRYIENYQNNLLNVR